MMKSMKVIILSILLMSFLIFVTIVVQGESIPKWTPTEDISTEINDIQITNGNNMIGDIQPIPEIKIMQQEYIDAYIDWNFVEINNTHWMANFTIDKDFWNNATYCRNRPNLIQRRSCFITLCDNFLSGYMACNATNRDRILNDIANFISYPLKNLTSDIKFSNPQINLNNGTANFYIIFPAGFKEGEKAEFGFGTTQINTGTSTGCTPDKRCICNSNTQKFIVYRYNTTHIFLANTSLSGNNGWTLNQSFYIGTTVYDPVISCSGDNVTVGIPDYNLDDFIVINSLNNGDTWTTYTPVTDSVNQDEMSIFTKGNKIYGLWWNDSADEYTGFFVINNNDGSNIIAPKTIQTITTGTWINYSTTDAMLWFKQFSTGNLMTAINSTDNSLNITQSLCIQFSDGTIQCTASSGGGEPEWEGNYSDVAFLSGQGDLNTNQSNFTYYVNNATERTSFTDTSNATYNAFVLANISNSSTYWNGINAFSGLNNQVLSSLSNITINQNLNMSTYNITKYLPSSSSTICEKDYNGTTLLWYDCFNSTHKWMANTC